MDNINQQTLSARLDDLEPDYITSTPDLPLAAHSDNENEDPNLATLTSNELRRAKSAVSVRSLKDMFESISSGTSQGDLRAKGVDQMEEVEEGEVVVPRSKSFSGVLPAKRPGQSLENGSATPVMPAKNKKKKSGVAKKIEKKHGSERNLAKRAADRKGEVICGPGANDDPLLTVQLPDSLSINNKKKSKFKLFKKKKTPSKPSSPTLNSASESSNPTLNDTQSLIFSNKSDTMTSSATISSKTDPLFTIANPGFKSETSVEPDYDMTMDTTNSFVRNSLNRRTAPPKMNRSVAEDELELVDSSACRRDSHVVDTSREALVLQTNSPQARTLLRNSMRGSRRSLGRESLDFRVPSTIQIARTASQHALLNPPQATEPGHVISKAVYSPKPKRAQKVKVDNVAMEDNSPSKAQLLTESVVIHRESCSPLPQRSKKVRLSQTRRSPARSTKSFSSDSDCDFLPERPDILKLSDESPEPLLPSTLSLLASDSKDSLDSSRVRPKSLLSNSDSHYSSCELLNTERYRTFLYSKHSPVDPTLRRPSLPAVPSPDQPSPDQPSPHPSEYTTPASHNSTVRQSDQFYSPNQSFSDPKRWSTSSVPVKRPSEAAIQEAAIKEAKRPAQPAILVAKRSSDLGLTDPLLSALRRTSPPRAARSTEGLAVTGKCPRDTGGPERIEPSAEHRLNRVLEETMGSSDHSSINHILAKYRKPPSTSSDTNSPKPSQSSTNEGNRNLTPKEPLKLERKTSNPQQRVKMITQLSNSFDKRLERLMGKYYQKKDLS